MVSVIILTYNTRELTLKCLKALFNSTYTDFEVIVVDNASTDNTSKEIKNLFPKVKLISNTKNLGFAKGNNQAMETAKGDWILLLNSDAFVFEDTLTKLMTEIEKNPTVSVFGCKLLNRDGTIQQSWGYFPTLRRVIQMMLFIDNLPFLREKIDSIHVRSERRHSFTQEVDWVTGAFVILKKEVFSKVGGIDENYFMYGEEMEWMFRIKKEGFKIAFLHKPECVHLLGASSNSRMKAVVGEMKGWIYWFNKHNMKSQVKILALVVLIGCKLRSILKPGLKENYETAFKEIKSEVFDLSN